MRIAFIGKFGRMHDEEYIARSFEALGCEVQRVDERLLTSQILGHIELFNPDYVIWTKLMVTEPPRLRAALRKYKTICWVFDLYWSYQREYRLTTHPAFTADYVFTTDGGHDEDFKRIGLNHKCVRQGVYEEECYVLPKTTGAHDIVFVGSENGLHPTRAKQLAFVASTYGDKFKWYGRLDTNEVRGTALNELYATTKIVVGDSVYAPHYWSNRVVETLGRGGFLIHREVPGLKEEYPDLVTYDGTLEDLRAKIDYYLVHDEEREAIIRKNFDLVQSRYTMKHKCQELLSYL